MASIDLFWRKSSYSGANDNCVEVAQLTDGNRVIRDSKTPEGPTLGVSAGEWKILTVSLKSSELSWLA